MAGPSSPLAVVTDTVSETVRNMTGSVADDAAEPTQRSLFGEILDWMLAPLLLLWPMSIAVTYIIAKSIANAPFDHALNDSVTVLAQQVREINGHVVLQLPIPAREILRADDTDSIYYLVQGYKGELVGGDQEMPAPPEEDKPVAGLVQFRNETLRGNDIRIAYTWVDLKKVKGAAPPNLNNKPVLVQVGETLEKRGQLANEIIKGVILPQFVILPIAVVLVWFGLSRGIKPLNELQYRIRARKPDDLSPIDLREAPEEVAPLVDSFNDLLQRLEQNVATQKRFIADAAHQMKTPLAGLRMQAELALRERDIGEIHRNLTQLSNGTQRATHLINQLLSLAKAENQAGSVQPMVPLDLAEVARDAMMDAVPFAIDHQIDLGFEDAPMPQIIMGNAILLREMIKNLLDNALRYTPMGGKVTLRLLDEAGEGTNGDAVQYCLLQVEDSGPGIPEAERELVFDRFYRVLGNSADGSGLGLAIVKEIISQHDATISVIPNPRINDPKLPGTLFTVRFKLIRTITNFDDML